MEDSSKTDVAQGLFIRPEGATMEEVISATGDYQYRALKRLESRGYRIKRAKEGRQTRYWAIAPETESYQVRVASDGKLTMPKAFRERLGIRKGGTVRMTSQGGKITMESAKLSILDFVGVLPKPRRAATLDEMDKAIVQGAVSRYLRSKR